MRHDAASDAQAVGRHLSVFIGAEVVGGNGWRVFEVGTFERHAASAAWIQVAHAGGDGWEAVQRFTKGIQAKRLHVVLNVGKGLRRIALCESAQLTGRHAHGPAAREGIFKTNFGFSPPAAGQGVQRFGVLHFVNRANLQMVLQIGAHAWQIVLHFNTYGLECVGISNA